MSVRVCVLGSGSRGNSTWIATEKTHLLVDAGFSKKETYARLAAVGERPELCDALLVSHEHVDHIGGVSKLALDLKVPVWISGATRDTIHWDRKVASFEIFSVGQRFLVGDIEVTPFSIPHDAVEPVAFTISAQGIKVGVVTDLGCIPELVKHHARGCHCLVWESNHDLEMLRVGPYPWFVKQRLMSRHGHLSNDATAHFLSEEYDGKAQVLVLAHLSETNNHPEIARMTVQEALSRRSDGGAPELHLASQTEPTQVFQF